MKIKQLFCKHVFVRSSGKLCLSYLCECVKCNKKIRIWDEEPVRRILHKPKKVI